MTPNSPPGPPPCSTGFLGNLDIAEPTKTAGRHEAHRRTILCVDDDRVVLDLQRALLQAAGFAVETVDDPHEALRAFSRKAPDAVVLDYAMPSMNGGVLALRMRRLRAQIPLILNSGSAEIPKEEAELFDRNLAKGLAPVLLISALHEIFAGRKDGDLRAPSDGVLHRVIAETRCAVITIKLPVSVSAQPAVEVPELTTGSLN